MANLTEFSDFDSEELKNMYQFNKEMPKNIFFSQITEDSKLKNYSEREHADKILKHEQCIEWLNTNNYIKNSKKSLKDLQSKIDLLKWKKKHLENIHVQKIKENGLKKDQGVRNSPNCYEGFKCDLASSLADDGFESLNENSSNLLSNISELESQLKKKNMKIQIYEKILGCSSETSAILSSDKLNYSSSLSNTIDRNKKMDLNRTLPYMYERKKLSSRPTSFTSQFGPEHSNSLTSTPISEGSLEVLKLKSELLVKDQHLRKIRSSYKELSARYHELLEQHMDLVKLHEEKKDFSSFSFSPIKRSSPFSTNLIEEVNCIVEELQDVLKRASNDKAQNTNSLSRRVHKNLNNLHKNIDDLKLKFSAGEMDLLKTKTQDQFFTS